MAAGTGKSRLQMDIIFLEIWGQELHFQMAANTLVLLNKLFGNFRL
jgi:hypothetical protein